MNSVNHPWRLPSERENQLRETSLAIIYYVEHNVRRQDVLIDLAFALGLVLLVLPDTFFYTGSVRSFDFWLNVASSASDAVLFSTVFIFLKIEIRKRRAVNDQLARANRLKSEFLQIAAHDLRNPLTAILLTASQIPPEKDVATGDDFDPGAEIRTTVNEMLGIIGGLLDAAAMEEGTLQLNRTHLDLADCVGDVVERNRALAKHKNQQLFYSTRVGCLANVDCGRIKQAMDNLVSNAIKFSPRGESITVTLDCDGDHARIEVSDHGPGLTDEDKAQLFSRYAHLSARPTAGEPSTGLGLANARQLVELHGGEIGAASDGPGQGSRFWIKLPTVVR